MITPNPWSLSKLLGFARAREGFGVGGTRRALGQGALGAVRWEHGQELQQGLLPHGEL